MNRITIIGGSGTGKTTLATNLSLDLKLPVYHLDAFNYFPNWQERDKTERDKLILEKLKDDKWVIDGTYTSTLKERLDMSDIDDDKLLIFKSRYQLNKWYQKEFNKKISL